MFKSKFKVEKVNCNVCGEPVWAEDDGLVHPRNCLCERTRQEQEKKGSILDLITKKHDSYLRINPITDKKLFQECTFNKFDRSKEPEAYEKTFKYAKYFKHYLPTGQGFCLIGKTGSGKTHLSIALCHELKFNTCVFMRMQDLITLWKDFESEILNCDLLILDDLTKLDYSQEWKRLIVYNIIDTRLYDYAPIVFTTDQDPEKLKQLIGSDIIRRLVERCKPFFMRTKDKDTTKNHKLKEEKV